MRGDPGAEVDASRVGGVSGVVEVVDVVDVDVDDEWAEVLGDDAAGGGAVVAAAGVRPPRALRVREIRRGGEGGGEGVV